MNCKVCDIKLKKTETYKCSICGKILCGKHIFQRWDESGACCRNPPAMCEKCYGIKNPYEYKTRHTREMREDFRIREMIKIKRQSNIKEKIQRSNYEESKSVDYFSR